MEKIIVTDASSNLYAFDGAKLEPLGKLQKIRPLWKDRIFEIAGSFYLKEGGAYKLLSQGGEFYAFAKNPPQIQQFFNIEGRILFVEPQKAGFTELPLKLNTLLFPKEPLAQEFFDKAFVLLENNLFFIGIQPKDKQTVSGAVSIFKKNDVDAFVFQNRPYVLENDEFVLKHWESFWLGAKNYWLMKAGDVVFAVHANGSFTALGKNATLKHGTKGVLLLFLETPNSCWHLGEDFIYLVVSGTDKDAIYTSQDNIVCCMRDASDHETYKIDTSLGRYRRSYH